MRNLYPSALAVAVCLFAPVLQPHAPSAGGGGTGAALAKQIRDDQSLRQVHRMALDLLKGGLNAGTHYPQVWIRDLNTFIIVALEANPRGALRDALLTFFKFQGPEGDIVDGYLPLNPNSREKPYRVTPLAPGLQSHKNTIEVDQETSLVQAVWIRSSKRARSSGFTRRASATRIQESASSGGARWGGRALGITRPGTT